MFEMKGASYIFWLKMHILHMRKLKPTLLDPRSQIPGFENQILLGEKKSPAGEIGPVWNLLHWLVVLRWL